MKCKWNEQAKAYEVPLDVTGFTVLEAKLYSDAKEAFRNEPKIVYEWEQDFGFLRGETWEK